MKKSIHGIFLMSIVLSVFCFMGCFGGGGGVPGLPGEMPTPSEVPQPTTTPTPSPTYSPLPGTTGNLEGTVYVAESGGSTSPAANALVVLMDLALSTYTNEKGEFEFKDITAGQRMVMITHNGVKTSGMVHIVAGKTTVLTVEMPSGNDPNPTPPSETARLNVIAHSFYEGSKWIGVEYIRVWEYGNYNKRWYNSWGNEGNEGQSSYQLSCHNAAKNKYYVAEVKWYNGSTVTKDTIYLYYDNQTEFIYHY